MNFPRLGSTKEELDTPALCIDLDVFEGNIRTMAATCGRYGVQWRPHSKCHKSSEIARQQLAAGAVGVTCAKLSEAEVMAAGGVRDILIANLLIGRQKLARLAKLCRVADPIVCLDHIEQAEALSVALSDAGQRVRVLIEVDIGLGRVGVQPGLATRRLAERLGTLPGLQFSGLMGYEGHLLTIADQQEKGRRIHEALDILVDGVLDLRAAGLACPIVSCGGTGSYFISAQHPGITEVQAGGGVFMDVFYREVCQVPELQFAVTVLSSVVSRPAADRAVIDAGRKTLNQELCMPQVVGQNGVRVEALSAEHGRLSLHPSSDLRIGQRIELLPGYVDFTTVLHDHFYCFRGNRLEAIWPIEGRGAIR